MRNIRDVKWGYRGINNSLFISQVGLQGEVKELRAEVQKLWAEGRNSSSVCEHREPQYVVADQGQNTIVIGTSNNATYIMSKDIYDKVFERENSPKELIVKLMAELFSKEQLARSNFHGGVVFNGKERVVKECMRKKPAFVVIMSQGALEFPRLRVGDGFQKELKDAVNAKC